MSHMLPPFPVPQRLSSALSLVPHFGSEHIDDKFLLSSTRNVSMHEDSTTGVGAVTDFYFRISLFVAVAVSSCIVSTIYSLFPIPLFPPTRFSFCHL